jgi:putative DNA primase/helicase
LPPSADRSYAFYRRWLIIPFAQTFKDRAADKGLRAKLVRELPGILNRALAGLRRLSEQGGFTEPQVVKDALGEYERQNDTVAAFLAERVHVNPLGHVAKQRLYGAYVGWCDRQRLRPVSQTALKPALYRLYPMLDEARVSSKGKRGGEGPWHWIGISLVTDG